VSTATVSRALNLPDKLSKRMLARVHAAIAETGYIPNLSTGEIITNRSRLVAMMMPRLPLMIFDAAVQGVVATLEAESYQTMCGFFSPLATREHLVTQVLGRRPAAMILIGLPMPPELRELLADTDLPVVQTYDIPAAPADMAVGFSNDRVGETLARFVLRKGYKRPMLLAVANPQSLKRRYAMAHALMEAGKPEPPHLDCTYHGSVGEGRRALATILDRGERPDLLICSSDWLAQGALIEARVRGLQVPGDIAVIGFGDFEFAAELVPSLTSVRIDGDLIGRTAAELVLDRIRSDRRRGAVIDIGFSLMEREST